MYESSRIPVRQAEQEQPEYYSKFDANLCNYYYKVSCPALIVPDIQTGCRQYLKYM